MMVNCWWVDGCFGSTRHQSLRCSAARLQFLKSFHRVFRSRPAIPEPDFVNVLFDQVACRVEIRQAKRRLGVVFEPGLPELFDCFRIFRFFARNCAKLAGRVDVLHDCSFTGICCSGAIRYRLADSYSGTGQVQSIASGYAASRIGVCGGVAATGICIRPISVARAA